MSNRSDVFNCISRYKGGVNEYDNQKIKDAFLWLLQYFSIDKVMLLASPSVTVSGVNQASPTPQISTSNEDQAKVLETLSIKKTTQNTLLSLL